jgi:hypothetical protein
MGRQVPQNWQRLLFESISQVGVSQSLDSDALSLVTKAAAGELLSLEVVTDLTKTGRLMHFVVGSWRPHLPADAAVVMTDATGDVDDIMAVVGRAVVDCTPAGHLPLMHPVVQIPDDISRTTASKTVAGYVEAFLTANPDVQRLGIFGHSHHIHDLIDGGLLSESARARVVKWTYFGAGDDRGSNSWHQNADGSPACQQLLRLGSPRANPGDYRRWLVQHGLHDAAGRPPQARLAPRRAGLLRAAGRAAGRAACSRASASSPPMSRFTHTCVAKSTSLRDLGRCCAAASVMAMPMSTAEIATSRGRP